MSLTPLKAASYSTPKAVTNRKIDDFLVKIREEKMERWEFDFEKEKAVKKENGNIKWTGVSPSQVPMVYRPIRCSELMYKNDAVSPKLTPQRQSKVTDYFPAKKRGVSLLKKMAALSFETDENNPSEEL